jgi:hypothetical protein
MTRAEFTTGAAKENRNFKGEMEAESAGRVFRRGRLVAGAREDGEPRVFGVGGIGGGALAEEKG